MTFASTSASRSFRSDGYFCNYQDVQQYNGQLADDILYVFSLSYQMMKKSMRGFAILSIPFWFVTVGVISFL